MPTIRINDKKLAKYTIRFYSFDCQERMHVHVESDATTAKFWIGYDEQTHRTTVELFDGGKYSQTELNTIQKALHHHGKTISKQWTEHCKNYRPNTSS